MMISRRTFLTLAIILLSSCMTSRLARQPQQDEPTILVVDNQAFLEMTIYVLRGSERVRIGQAGALKVTKLTIPANLLFGATSLRFLADPIGSTRTPVSDEITVAQGDEITLRIPPQ